MDKSMIYRLLVINNLDDKDLVEIDNNNIIYAEKDGKHYKIIDEVKQEYHPQNNSHIIDDFIENDIIETEKEVSDKIDLEVHDLINLKHEKDSTIIDEVIESTKDLNLLITTITKTRSTEELKRLKEIKKPKGWHFRAEYIDIEGNIYLKGKLQ